MFDYAIKNITKRWIRSLLTIVGVTVMITLVIVITGNRLLPDPHHARPRFCRGG